jgi:peptide/nickel transport system substrate-binding protein
MLQCRYEISRIEFPRKGQMNRARNFLMAIAFMFLAACTPVRIPTSDVTPTRPITAPPFAPTQVQTPSMEPVTAAPTGIPTPTASTGPEGGALSVGSIGGVNPDVNLLPAIVQNALFDSLLQVDPASGALKPALAESYQVSNDALTITFRLRANTRFHNGDTVTADDVVATIKAFSDPSFRGTPVTDFGTFARATALDAVTVQLSFSDGYCPALASIGTLKIFPRAVATSVTFPRLTTAQLIGTGPFKLAARTEDQFTFERYADYFRSAPHLDSLIVRVYSDPAALRAAFASKQIDLMPTDPNDYAAIRKISEANVLATDSPEFIGLLFNIDTTTLSDPRVRQALTFALDRQVLLNDIGGQARTIDVSALPEYWAWPKNLPGYTLDIVRAKQLLADAGWRANGDGLLQKNGKPMQLDLWAEADDPIMEPLAFRIREMYAALGIQAQLQLDDRPGWVTRAFDHRFDLLLFSRKIPIDPDQHWYWQSNQNDKGNGFNFGSYSNARVDGLFKDSLHIPVCDAGARAAIFAEIDRTLVADAPMAFLFAPKKYLVARERVLGLAPSSFAGDFWNLNAWRVK